MPAKSRSQQRLFGMVRAAQKGELEAPSPKVSQIAATTSVSSVKKFAKTKHKGLPEKKKMNENNPRQTGIPNNPNILQRIDAMLPGNAFSYQGFKQQTYSPTPYKSPYTGPNYTGNKVDVDNYRAGGGNAAMAGGQTADQVRAQGAKNLKARPKQPNVHNWTDNGVKNYAGSPPMRFKVEALRSSILSDRKAMKKIDDREKSNKEQDMRMKHGKSWKKYRQDSGEKPLRKGEVRRYDKAKGKYVSNMPEGIDDDIRAKSDANKHMTTQEKKNLEKKSSEGRGADLLNRLLRGV